MQTETAIQRAARLAGGPAALAKRLGESVQTVCNWVSRGEPPANKAVAVELATGVGRRELRSDWNDYWPEESKSKKAMGCSGTQALPETEPTEVPAAPDERNLSRLVVVVPERERRTQDLGRQARGTGGRE